MFIIARLSMLNGGKLKLKSFTVSNEINDKILNELSKY